MNAGEYIQEKINDNKLDTTKFFTTFVKETVNGTLSGMDNFISEVNTYYDGKTNPSNPDSYIYAKNEDTFNDLKKTTYYNIKQIYEKVSGMSKKSVDSMDSITVDKKLNDLELMNLDDLKLFYNFKLDQGDCLNEKGDNTFDLYEIFQVIDRGNSDVGTKVLADLTVLNQNLYTDFSNEVSIKNSLNPMGNNPFSKLLTTTVSTLFSDLASQGGFNFYQIPNYLNLSSVLTNSENKDDVTEMVDHLFGVHTDTGLFGDFQRDKKTNTFYGGLSGFPGYIFQIGASPSALSHYSTDQKIKNNFNSSFCLDLVTNKNGDVSVTNEDVPDDIKKSNVTSFIIDFGKQNQQMFNSIELDSAQFAFTEHSITTWTDLVNSNNNRALTTNMFPIYEKYMYTCKVSGMGNATIQPFTYFYLRNTPMFYGTYWITNVSHNITPNNMTTSFQGVRQPIATKNDTRRILLDLYKQAAGKLSGATEEANTVITEGVLPTSGVIKKNINSDKPFKEFLQPNQGRSGKSPFDGKTILGSYVYSITQSNNKTPTALGIIASLYNLSKSYSKTEDHNTIISNMVNIAITNMTMLCIAGDTRYDDGNNNISLYKLFKISGNGYSSNSPLSTLLDNICISGDSYKRELTLNNTDKVFGVNITPAPTQSGHKEYKLELSEEIGTGDGFDLSTITMFVDNAAQKYLDDKYPAIGVYTMFNVFSGHTSLGKAETTYQPLKNIKDTNTVSLFNFSPVNVSNKTQDDSLTPISIKYMGAYDASAIFFSTKIRGVDGFIDFDGYPEYKSIFNRIVKAENSDLADIPRTTTYGTLKNNYTTNVVIKLEEEWAKWNNGNQVLFDTQCSNATVVNLLDTYWSAVGSSLRLQGGCGTETPWSAAFMSYIMKNSGVVFPSSTKHSIYIQKARTNTKSGGTYPWYGYNVTDPNAIVDVGDLLCYTRDESINTQWDDIVDSTNTHCDCVTKIDYSNPGAPIAEVIGGNVSNTVKRSTVILTSNRNINLSGKQSNYRGILKYKPQEVIIGNSGSIQIPLFKQLPKKIQSAYDLVESNNPGFKNKVKEVATKIGAAENDLVTIIYKESGINSKAQYGVPIDKYSMVYVPIENRNPKGSATGFIQFLESTAKGLNTTTRDLWNMSPIQQMDYVLSYFAKQPRFNANSTNNIFDLYAAVFYPAAINKPINYIIGSEVSEDKAIEVANKNEVIKNFSTVYLKNQKVIDVNAFLKYVQATV